METELCQKDRVIDNLSKKILVIEESLLEKDKLFKVIVEKVKRLEERQETVENKYLEVSVCERTFLNPSDLTLNCE